MSVAIRAIVRLLLALIVILAILTLGSLGIWAALTVAVVFWAIVGVVVWAGRRRA